jgi:hypothetical protein
VARRADDPQEPGVPFIRHKPIAPAVPKAHDSIAPGDSVDASKALTGSQRSSLMSQQPQGIRIGQLLVAQGVLNEEQVEQIVERQREVGRPFGDLAERMFEVDPDAVERAWIDQYLGFGTEADLNEQHIEEEVLELLTRRQAWQFRILPLRREEDELIVATSREHFRRAVNFAWRRLEEPLYFLIVPPAQLEQYLMHHYPWPGVLTLPEAG